MPPCTHLELHDATLHIAARRARLRHGKSESHTSLYVQCCVLRHKGDDWRSRRSLEYRPPRGSTRSSGRVTMSRCSCPARAIRTYRTDATRQSAPDRRGACADDHGNSVDSAIVLIAAWRRGRSSMSGEADLVLAGHLRDGGGAAPHRSVHPVERCVGYGDEALSSHTTTSSRPRARSPSPASAALAAARTITPSPPSGAGIQPTRSWRIAIPI